MKPLPYCWSVFAPGRNTRRLCLMNMFLHNIGEIDGEALISPNDALVAPSAQSFDFVLAKANVIFFDYREAGKNPWTKEVWYYDYRTNIHHTLKKKPLRLEHLAEFIECSTCRTGTNANRPGTQIRTPTVAGESTLMTSWRRGTKRAWIFFGLEIRVSPTWTTYRSPMNWPRRLSKIWKRASPASGRPRESDLTGC